MKPSVKIRHSIVSLLLICSCVVVASNTQAAAPKQQELAAGSALLVDLQTNQVLFERNADSVVPIASPWSP